MISDLTTTEDNSVISGSNSPLATCHSPLLFAVPTADLTAFSHLPDAVRTALNITLLCLRQIHEAKSKSREAAVIAARYAGQRGFSAESLLRKYYKYLASGDWREVMDRAAAGPAFWQLDAPIGLPKAFVEFWKALCERNQRKTAPARRELLRIWQTGKGLDPATGKTIYYKTFPGYPDWSPSKLSPQSSALSTELPAGWSVANLNRHAPSKFELAVARRGRDAASAYRRKVFTTRAGLHVGEFYLFDDLEYDLLVNFPGNRIATRPLGLVALDLLSACAVGLGFKPVLIDPEGTKRKLKERDMLWLVVHVLCHKGYRTDKFGTHLVVERGTAAIRADFEERILAATQGKVTVQRSGVSAEHMPGLFEGQSKGNPRFKAALESLFNLVHNEGAMLPAQTGLDRDHKPIDTVGLERYNKQLLQLAESLPEHRRRLLQFPVLSYEDFRLLTLDIFDRINQRTEHSLEGWQKCGHIEQEFFLEFPEVGRVAPRAPAPEALVSAPQASIQTFSESQWLALPPRARAALKDQVNARARQLSPQEVWNRGAGDLQKLPESALPILLGLEFGEERAVRGGYITIEDQEIDSEPLRFNACLNQSPLAPRPSPLEVLPEGSKYLTYLSPLNPDRLILTDAKGRFLGALDRQIAPTRSDIAAVHRELGQARHEEAERLTPVLGRALPLVKARAEMHRTNAAVFEGQPVTPEEITAAQDLRARLQKIKSADVDEFLQAEAAAPVAPAPEAGAPAVSIDESDIETFL